MKVIANEKYFVIEVPKANAESIAGLMAYRGLIFSTSASTSDKAVLFATNPYALADIAEDCPELEPYYRAIGASRALDGVGTTKLPPGRELWPYQRASLDYVIERNGGILGDQPGLGKTPEAIAFCNHFEATRVLVICPASVRLQWGERIAEWSTVPNLNCSVMLKVKDGIHPTANFVVLGFEAARNPAIIRAIGKYEWDVLIIDEAHKLKNIDALTTRAILGNSRGEYQHGEHKIPAIASKARRKLALTGTPLLNRPSECFTLLRHFDHEAIDFMGWDDFKEKYNKQADIKTITGKRFKLESTSNETELQNRLRTHVMARHEKRDVFQDMKPPRFSIVRVSDDGAVRDALDVEGMIGLDIEEIQTTKDFEILGHIAEARRLMGEAIVPQVIEYAADFLEGSDEKLVIFAWHVSVLNLLEQGLSRFGTVRVDGSKSPTQRKIAVDDFVEKDHIRVFLGNILAAGVGVDGLQKVCSRCLIPEPDWVPANNEQAVARLDRIGQENLVNAEIFVAPGSISEKILVKALEKMNVIHRVLDQKE